MKLLGREIGVKRKGANVESIIMFTIAIVVLGAVAGTIITTLNSTGLGRPNASGGGNHPVTGAAAVLADNIVPLIVVAAGVLAVVYYFIKKK